MKLIELEAAVDVACNAVEHYPSEWEAIEAEMRKLPVVEERKHGHWGKDDYKCSVCGAKRPTTDTASKWIYLDQRYCYNCGAAMDEEEKADE